jgi:hypothetical protein
LKYVKQEPPEISVFQRHSAIYLKQLQACVEDTMDLITAVTDREFAEIHRRTKNNEDEDTVQCDNRRY